MRNEWKQQYSSKTKNEKQPETKQKVKKKYIKEKTSKQGAPPTPQEKIKRQRERFRQ